jgi:hypothetical protein
MPNVLFTGRVVDLVCPTVSINFNYFIMPIPVLITDIAFIYVHRRVSCMKGLILLVFTK